MKSLDRLALEEAANEFLVELIRIVDKPRKFHDGNFEAELGLQIEATVAELERQQNQLLSGEYTDGDRNDAREMLKPIGVSYDDLAPSEEIAALSHVVRAKRQQMRFFMHSLTTPASRFKPDDDLFVALEGGPSITTLPAKRPYLLSPEITLKRGVSLYIDYQSKKGWQGSMRDESQRVLRWMQEEIANDTPISGISREIMRDFRDGLMSLKAGAQGKKLAFSQRIAAPKEQVLKFVTRERYWRFTKGFFAWFKSEYAIPDPTEGLLFEGKKEVRQSPEPFSTDELRKFFVTPVFSGFKSTKRLKSVGDCHLRQGHWWSALIMLFTGMRASDIAQLLPSDFQLDDAVPHILIQPGKLPEGVKKRSKFADRTHLIPLHSALLDLGLREFVEEREKQKTNRRTFHEISLGKNRMSGGLSKFWGRYLREFDLHKPGRGPHTFRHTLAARLRASYVSEEDIGALLGHAPSSVTGSYGGSQDPVRKMTSLLKLDFGFDVVALLGGKYDPAKHRY